MPEIGRYTLIAASVICLYSVIASVLGARLKKAAYVESAERAVIAVVFLVVVAVGILLHALITHNFEFEYVAHYSSSTLPTPYCVTALWGGQGGSMLFWLMVLGFYTIVALLQNQNRNRQLMPYVTAVLMSISFFFLIVLIFAANPFERIFPVPLEGQDLNPLLQNYWMASHPPSLYTGYVGQSIPFAFAMAALITGRLDVSWLKTIRKWTIFSWLFLTLGILQGSYWAYIELGWGGYWAWDPVENASLMPWLTSTAFLHSVMVQEKKGMLKKWNMVLVLMSFVLSILGTFLTRSGVVSSVHAFAQSAVGNYFVVFLGISIAFCIFWLVKRNKELAPETRLESFVSRESSFLFNNVFFLVICLAVLSGTTFPILSEWVTGSKVTVGAPFFNKVVAPFAFGLVLLTGICPLIAWRKAGVQNLKRNFLTPFIIGLIGVAILIPLGIRNWIALSLMFSSFFVLATVYLEFSKGTQARMAMIGEPAPVALIQLIERNRRRYGGFIIHTGAAIMIMGIAISSFYRLEKDFQVAQGQSFNVGKYNIVYRQLRETKDPHVDTVRADLEIYRNGQFEGMLFPERNFYTASEQPTTEVAIRPFWDEDLYLIISGWDDRGTATFKTYVNPMIGLLWKGAIIMGLGGLIVLLPAFKHRPATAPARDELGQEA
ncbi:MAG: cytochrome C biogenesis protein [Acidobacteria bacterium]|nr:MAG: cytochrome C biogenesis protein [Acidobacteriota bacterium]